MVLIFMLVALGLIACRSSTAAPSLIFTLPSELLQLIIIAAVANGPISTLAAISETCRAFHSLIYSPADHNLWREIFSNIFDDPRLALTYLAILHGEQPDVQWREALKLRMRAAQVVRVSNRLSSSTSEIATIASRLEESLRTLLNVISTSLPLVKTKISIETTSYSGREIVPAFPPLILLLAASLCGFSSLPGHEFQSTSAQWLEELLGNGFPCMLTRNLLADTSLLPIDHNDEARKEASSVPEAIASAKHKLWEASEEARLFYKLIAHTGFIPVTDPRDRKFSTENGVPLEKQIIEASDNSITSLRSPSADPSSSGSRSAYPTTQEQCDSARRKARTTVYDLKFLKPDRLFGPFTSSPAEDGLNGDQASAVSLMALADEDDSDDSDYESEETETDMNVDADEAEADPYDQSMHVEAEEEDPYTEYSQQQDADDPIEDGDGIIVPLVDLVTYDPQTRPLRSPPLPHTLTPDWKWISAARIVVEANIRDMLGRSPTVDFSPQEFAQDEKVLEEVGNALKRMEGLRMGGAPDFWRSGWATTDGAEPPLDRKGKGKAGEDGWDWAGVAGTWKRCTCWLDYRDLLSTHFRFFPQIRHSFISSSQQCLLSLPLHLLCYLMYHSPFSYSSLLSASATRIFKKHFAFIP